jgi:hypothetical protein
LYNSTILSNGRRVNGFAGMADIGDRYGLFARLGATSGAFCRAVDGEREPRGFVLFVKRLPKLKLVHRL